MIRGGLGTCRCCKDLVLLGGGRGRVDSAERLRGGTSGCTKGAGSGSDGFADSGLILLFAACKLMTLHLGVRSQQRTLEMLKELSCNVDFEMVSVRNQDVNLQAFKSPIPKHRV